jgi:hypothetical protein
MALKAFFFPTIENVELTVGLNASLEIMVNLNQVTC